MFLTQINLQFIRLNSLFVVDISWWIFGVNYYDRAPLIEIVKNKEEMSK